jgi:hypothetical protein
MKLIIIKRSLSEILSLNSTYVQSDGYINSTALFLFLYDLKSFSDVDDSAKL